MKPKRYEGKTPDEIRDILNSGELSRSTHYRIRKGTGISTEKIQVRSSEANAYEYSKGEWI